MEIYLVHPNHGKKIAYLRAEAENDKKSGWREVTQDEFYPKAKKPALSVVSDAQAAGGDEGGAVEKASQDGEGEPVVAKKGRKGLRGE